MRVQTYDFVTRFYAKLVLTQLEPMKKLLETYQVHRVCALCEQ